MIDYSKATLLSVLAHPDDESFGSGGTLALYARRGVNIHLVCATRGEVGDVDPAMLEGYESVGDLREAELRCAAGHLGLKEIHFLGYRDSGMPGSPDNSHPNALFAQPIDQVAAQVASFIRQLKPQVVITFDPIGGYYHPDHIAIHKATVMAFSLAADPNYHDPQDLPAYQANRLYYQTISKKFLKAAVFTLRMVGRNPKKFGRNGDIDLQAISAEEFPVNARINFGEVLEQRNAASACHASQGGKEMTGGIQRILERIFRSDELYTQAYPLPAPRKPVKDLFAGVELEAKYRA